jgi:hypothetical protein
MPLLKQAQMMKVMKVSKAKKANTMRIRLESAGLNGCYSWVVDEDISIGAIKRKLQAESCWVASSTELWFAGNRLPNQATLKELGLNEVDERTLHMSKVTATSAASSATSSAGPAAPPQPSKRNRIQLPLISPVEKEYFRLCRILLDMSPVSEDEMDSGSGAASSGVAPPPPAAETTMPPAAETTMPPAAETSTASSSCPNCATLRAELDRILVLIDELGEQDYFFGTSEYLAP